eukprot:COSAG02_NODE_2774_length_8057_cov_4.361146_5_plen_69_part_00
MAGRMGARVDCGAGSAARATAAGVGCSPVSAARPAHIRRTCWSRWYEGMRSHSDSIAWIVAVVIYLPV